MREMNTLSPITYNDTVQGLRLSCYADTFVYHKASGSERNLVAMRFGGYPEQVRVLADRASRTGCAGGCLLSEIQAQRFLKAYIIPQ